MYNIKWKMLLLNYLVAVIKEVGSCSELSKKDWFGIRTQPGYGVRVNNLKATYPMTE